MLGIFTGINLFKIILLAIKHNSCLYSKQDTNRNRGETYSFKDHVGVLQVP